MIFCPNLANQIFQWNTHSVVEGQSDPAEVKIEPLFENRWNYDFWTCFTDNYVNVRIGIVGKGLFPTFALLNHRYISRSDFVSFVCCLRQKWHNAQLLLIVHVRNKHDPQPQLRQQPFQILPWRRSCCSSMQDYQGGRRGLTIKKRFMKTNYDGLV